jgi:hypothetical protein
VTTAVTTAVIAVRTAVRTAETDVSDRGELPSGG